jgi:cytochrome c oxidase cbb3-type subunit 3
MLFNHRVLFAAQELEKSAMNTNTSTFYLLIALIVVLMIAIIILAGAIVNVSSSKTAITKLTKKTGTAILIGALILPEQLHAAELALVITQKQLLPLIAVVLFLSLIVLFLASTLKNILRELSNEAIPETPAISKFTASLTEAVPISEEETIMTDHVYDGIRELDNVLPPWWKYMFYLTIVFSVVYFIQYHMAGSGNIMEDEYNAELAAAAKLKAQLQEVNTEDAATINEDNAIQLTDAEDLSRGKMIYEVNCASCHHKNGGGGVGPNLTDEYWLHGGGINNIFSTIKYGVPEKGMIAWQSVLKADDIQRIASYIMSLSGTQPEGGKAPQGDVYKPEPLAPDSTNTTALNDTLNTAVE